MAASCSKLKRLWTDPLTSMSKPRCKRQIGFAAEVDNRLRRLVIVEDREIGLIQVADKFAVLVGGDEENVNFIHALVDGEHGAGLRIIR